MIVKKRGADIALKDLCFISLPFQPMKKMKTPFFFSTAIFGEYLASLFHGFYRLGINQLHSFKTYSENECSDFEKKFSFISNKTIYYDKDYIDDFVKVVKRLYETEDIRILCKPTATCECGRVEIVQSDLNRFHENSVKMQLKEDGEGGVECPYCKTKLVFEDQESLYLCFKEKELYEPVDVYPSYLDSDFNHFRGSLLNGHLRISRIRNTGISVVVDNRLFYLDIDLLWKVIPILLQEQQVVVVATVKHTFSMFIIHYLAQIIGPKNVYFVGLPFIDTNSVGTEVLDFFQNEEHIKALKLLVLLGVGWSKKNICLQESTCKYFMSSSAKNNELFHFIFHLHFDTRQWKEICKIITSYTQLQRALKIKKAMVKNQMSINRDLLALLRNNEQDVSLIIEKCNNINYYHALIEAAKKYKLLPNILYTLYCHENTVCSNAIKKSYYKNKKISEKQIDSQLKTMESINCICSQNQIVWMKGIPLSVLIYGDPTLRRIGDIDLLVDSDIQKAFIDELEDWGYKKVGIVNQEIGLRYSVHYHEIQMISPFSCFTEIKTISGEMNTVKNDTMISDFFEHTMEIQIEGRQYKTLDLTYTLLHLFLSAFSNSTTWYFMGDNGLRDIYEIVLFTKKYEVDYDKLYQAADSYGICPIISGTMNRINNVFGTVFKEKIISIFNHNIHKTHMVAKLYEYFTIHYTIDCMDDLFSQEIKSKAYYNALCTAYYDYDISFRDNYLFPEILEYNLSYLHKELRLELHMDSQYFFGDRESVFEMRFLCNNKKIYNKYGYIFLLVIKFRQGRAKLSLQNVITNKDIQEYNVDIQSDFISIVNNKVKIVVVFESIFLDPDCKKICYNMQLKIQNENDDIEFCITELCPGKNTFPIFFTDIFDRMSEFDNRRM